MGTGALTRRAALAGAASLAGWAAGPASAQSADVRPGETLMVDGRRRRYRLVVPASSGSGAPLMLALHGMGIDSISLMPRYSGLDELARAQGCVLAYPAAAENHWPLSFGPKLQLELAFLDALIAELQRRHTTDPRRVYLLGMSNGGYFAVVVASRRAERLAGLAVHSTSAGVMGVGFKTERKFPVVVAHGANDRLFAPRHGRYLADLFRRQGHPTEYAEYPGLGHIWARDQGVNDVIWSFWQRHRA